MKKHSQAFIDLKCLTFKENGAFGDIECPIWDIGAYIIMEICCTPKKRVPPRYWVKIGNLNPVLRQKETQNTLDTEGVVWLF